MKYQKMIPAFGAGFWKSKMFFLMVSMLLLFLIYPYAMMFGQTGLIAINAAVSLVILVAVVAVSQSKKTIVITLSLGIPAFFLNWMSLLGGTLEINILGHIFKLLFYGYVIIRILKHVFKQKKVTADEIYGAVSAYLLIGLFWAVVYSGLNLIFAGAFNKEMLVGDFIYFSFITLTTVGYGHIVPTIPQVQSLAFIEAIVGTLYLTVMVARLVGQYMIHGEK